MRAKIRTLKLVDLAFEAERKGLIVWSIDNPYFDLIYYGNRTHIYTGLDTKIILYLWKKRVFNNLKNDKIRGFSNEDRTKYLIDCFNRLNGSILGPIDIRTRRIG